MGRDDAWGNPFTVPNSGCAVVGIRIGTRDVIGARTSFTLPVIAAASDTVEPGSRNSFILDRTCRKAPAAYRVPRPSAAELPDKCRVGRPGLGLARSAIMQLSPRREAVSLGSPDRHMAPPPALDVSKDDPGDSPRGPLSVASDTSHSMESPSAAEDVDDDFTFDSPRASSPSFSPSSVSGNGTDGSFDRDTVWGASPASVTKRDDGERGTAREPRLTGRERRDPAASSAAVVEAVGAIASRPFQASRPIPAPTPPVDLGPETKAPISPRAAKAIGGWRVVRRPRPPAERSERGSRGSPRAKGRRLVFA